jgi:hypothetical protein
MLPTSRLATLDNVLPVLEEIARLGLTPIAGTEIIWPKRAAYQFSARNDGIADNEDNSGHVIALTAIVEHAPAVPQSGPYGSILFARDQDLRCVRLASEAATIDLIEEKMVTNPLDG